MKFLIVEDSTTVQAAVYRHLEQAFPKCEVVIANNGKEGFKMLTTHAFDIIITDLEMAGGDGAGFLGKITNSKVLAKKKIVIFSSKAPPMDLTKTPNIKYVDKALGATFLIETIKSLIL